MVSNGDVVEVFLRRSTRFVKGESFVLPDIGQRHTLEKVRAVPDGRRWSVYLDMSSGCAVCGRRYTYTKQLAQWRNRYLVKRCCDEHRQSWRTERGWWLTASERVERQAIAEAKPKRLSRPEFGAVEQVVVDVVEGLLLVYEQVNDRQVLDAAVDRLEPPAAGRDTRRQRVTRAMRSVADRGALPGGVVRGLVL